jgi:hypothetical protein
MTGATSRESSGELIKPPIITTGSGKSAPTAVSVVSTTGKKRISPACSIASFNGVPLARS